jgi:hypothetical protein
MLVLRLNKNIYSPLNLVLKVLKEDLKENPI